MELEELKQSWQKLDNRLQMQNITTEEQVAALIESYKQKTKRRLGSILDLQRASLTIGLILLAGVGFLAALLPSWHEDADTRIKVQLGLVFVALTLLAGGLWDWRTYRYIQQTRVDLMPIAEVSRRIVRLRLWTRQEVVAISLWVLLFGVLYYWIMDFHLLPAGIQAVIIGIFLLFEAAVIYLLYQRLIYKHLNQIHKDIEELKDVCTESH